MRAIVLSVGAELLRGDIVDTNAGFLARDLSQRGFVVERLVTAGDELESLTGVVAGALRDAELIVATGGLGPTEDDLTRNAIAGALHEELFVDEGLVAQIESRFAAMRRHMPARNRQQAELIPSATAIPNPNGTAPGWLVRRDGRTIVAMPGPPAEMHPMWTDSVTAVIQELLPGHTLMVSLMTFGLGESAVEQRISDVLHWHPGVTVATYAKPAGVQVHVTVRTGDEEEGRRLLTQTERRLRDLLGDFVFAMGDTTLAETVATVLRERGWTLSAMESSTGGTLSSLITDVEGSSTYFLGGVVAYTRGVKEQHGVDPSVMDEYGLISGETAAAMAAAAREKFASEVAIGVTGIAGREPVEGKPPGTCYIAVTVDGAAEVREIRRPGPRDSVKHFFAQSALDLTRRMLLERNRR